MTDGFLKNTDCGECGKQHLSSLYVIEELDRLLEMYEKEEELALRLEEDTLGIATAFMREYISRHDERQIVTDKIEALRVKMGMQEEMT